MDSGVEGHCQIVFLQFRWDFGLSLIWASAPKSVTMPLWPFMVPLYSSCVLGAMPFLCVCVPPSFVDTSGLIAPQLELRAWS